MQDEPTTGAHAQPDRPAALGAAGWAVLDGGAVLGPLALAWEPEGLVVLHFGPALPPDDAALLEEPPGLPTAPPPALADPLVAYLRGAPIEPAALPVKLKGTEFQQRVWRALRRVPRGQVRTYGGLAKDAGSPRATRAVGMAMARNPISVVVPCHRVVGARFALGGYSSGLPRKRHLLALEGVAVEDDRVRPGQLALDLPSVEER